MLPTHSSHSRRGTSHSDDDGPTADDSKTKKYLPISLLVTRFTNYFTRFGSIFPCLVALIFLLVLIFSLIFHSRSFVCFSPFNQVSRSGIFGFDGLESDFGLLGVPWCKIFSILLICCKWCVFLFRYERFWICG